MSRLRAGALHYLVWAAFVIGSLLQRPGETTFDVKLDLTEDPVGFLRRALDLWTPGIDLGSLQNQAYGYLFPMGPWYAVGHLIALPSWVTQRLWSALLLIAAYEGARRLAAALLPVGSVRGLPMLAGLGYSLSTRIFGLSGVLTGEILPSVVLPWVCLPLVLHHRGRMSTRRAGLLAGAAVLLMGGVNATENLATLVLPALLVVVQWRSAGGRRLAGWWALATTLACAWWMLPLVLLGKYGAPFLDYIETASGTTSASGWSNSFRGAEHWVGYIFVGGRPWWEAYYQLSTSTLLVILAGVLATVGMVGLFHPAMPLRLPFALSALFGLAFMTAGHGGFEGTPLAGAVRDLLDGPLAPFRNIHKADPLVRLPLVLGFVHVVGRLGGTIAGLVGAERRRAAPAAVVAIASVVLLATAAPMLAGTMRHPGWSAVPQAWRDAGSWLDGQGPGATLVLPATTQAEQTWGRTVDLPIQPMTSSAWVSRTQIPLVPPATIRVLDGIVDRLEGGVGSTGVAEELRRAGITRVLIASDVDRSVSDVADPAHVAAVLAADPSFRHERSFGTADDGRSLIDVYSVIGSTGTPTTRPAAGLVSVQGAPEDALSARDVGLVSPRETAVVGAARGGSPDIVSDGYRRVDREFGRLHDARGQVLTPAEPHRSTRKRTDFAGAPGVPPVVADYDGPIVAVTASTSSGDTDTIGPVVPAFGPASVVDGDDRTYWRSAPFTDPRDQWVDVRFDAPRPVGRVTVIAGVDGFSGTPVTRVSVSAGPRSVDVPVDASTGRAVVDLGRTTRASSVRVRIRAVRDEVAEASVALREVEVEGVSARRSLVVPDAGASGGTSFVFNTDGPRRTCQLASGGPRCDVFASHPGSEQGRLDRTFTVHGEGSWRVRGRVVAQPGPTVSRLLEPLGHALRARASSVLGQDPAASGMFAVDGDTTTSWRAAYGDMTPSLDLEWGTKRRIDRLTVSGVPDGGIAPVEAVIEAAGRTWTVSLTNGSAWFDPIRASSARITFHISPDPSGAATSMAVGEVHLDGTDDLVGAIAMDEPFKSTCGLGPRVVVDGAVRRTRVLGTLRDVVDGRPMVMRSCDGPVALAEGTNRVEVTGTSDFVPTTLVLASLTHHDAVVTDTSRVVRATPVAGVMDVDIAAGGEAVLTFGQNANVGWRATLRGRDLRPITVDGWQQAFIVPGGPSGRVHIEFGPGSTYVAALVVGLLGVLLLLLLLAWDRARPRPPEPPVRSRALSRPGAFVLLALWACLAGPVAAIATVCSALATRRLGTTRPLMVGGILLGAATVAAAYSAGASPSALANMLTALGVGVLAGTTRGEVEEEPRVGG